MLLINGRYHTPISPESDTKVCLSINVKSKRSNVLTWICLAIGIFIWMGYLPYCIITKANISINYSYDVWLNLSKIILIFILFIAISLLHVILAVKGLKAYLVFQDKIVCSIYPFKLWEISRRNISNAKIIRKGVLGKDLYVKIMADETSKLIKISGEYHGIEEDAEQFLKIIRSEGETNVNSGDLHPEI